MVTSLNYHPFGGVISGLSFKYHPSDGIFTTIPPVGQLVFMCVNYHPSDGRVISVLSGN